MVTEKECFGDERPKFSDYKLRIPLKVHGQMKALATENGISLQRAYEMAAQSLIESEG